MPVSQDQMSAWGNAAGIDDMEIVKKYFAQMLEHYGGDLNALQEHYNQAMGGNN